MTFDQVIDRWPQMLQMENLEGYAWTILKRRTIDMHRKRRPELMEVAAFEAALADPTEDPYDTLTDAIALPRRRELVADALESVGLTDAAGAYPWQLSGGMQQRVAIARALAYEPDVLLMDEPFAAVDAQTRADLEDLVRGLWRRRGITILFVTHDIDEAVYLGERVLILSASPTVVQEQLKVDLPDERDQLHTRVTPRFAELRTHVYEQIQAAKRGTTPEIRTDTPPLH
ncbi:hypothetical protein GCM10011579_079880 [Streptomyces albiflavescens]|uniref:ABC transporter domain-containing protein n=1 Tax=Streptomyces albiflavescens TaxID=1623582 RepID=A0A917YD01_9ACTN|nr:ATP-binding cassette domain-containing protein [Streptomyces albiflavescens]GGN87276.1 hypothetical protein GCM10011579_079880 [Streptomyces albiflavescens]